MEPKLLTTLSGEVVKDAACWEAFRREEILQLFQHYVYGERPVERPEDLSFESETISEDFHGLIYKKIKISFGEYFFWVRAFIPKENYPVPSFVYGMYESAERRWEPEREIDFPNLPVPNICARGYAVLVMCFSSIYPDWERKADYMEGVFKVLSPNRRARRDSDWASISAWAWGESRVMDYIETDPLLDEKQVAVVGHSRAGKTALWCGATDARFAYVVSNSSGCTGAAMLRGKTGEHIEYIAGVTDWFCANYGKYSQAEELLPVDQHMLLALIAPRLLYVQSSSEDDWADPRSERRACLLANEAYELYGEKGAVLPGLDEVEKDVPYHEGNIGYHMRTGEHDLTPVDWKFFMDFWDGKR